VDGMNDIGKMENDSMVRMWKMLYRILPVVQINLRNNTLLTKNMFPRYYEENNKTM
jgi:hypothetical protein